MTKKIVSALCALTLILTVSASANNGETQDRSEKAAARAEATEIKTQIKELSAEIRENNLELRLQANENKQLRQTCREHIQELKEQEDAQLSQETLDQLMQLQDQVQERYDQLEETKGDIRAEMLTFRSGRQDRDYDAMLASLQNVIGIQETRKEAQEQINGLLEQMADLLA